MMTARTGILLLLCITLLSCSQKKDNPEVPFVISKDSLISPEKMILILADVHVIEGALLLDRNRGVSSRHRLDFYYTGIFRKYHISPERYDQNFMHYRQNPDNYSRMYEKVIALIEARQKKITGKK